MDKQEIKDIIQKYLDGTASSEEQSQLQEWYNHYAVTKSHEAFPEDIWFRQQSTLEAILGKQAVVGGKPVFEEESIPRHMPNTIKVPLWRYIGIAAAAAAVVMITFGIWLFNSYYNGRHPDAGQDSAIAKNDIAPGKNTATLTLADGKKILLSDAVNGVLAKESGVVIRKDASGRLYYEISPSSQTNNVATAFNTLSTARGETYQVKLPDGTHIWLNAASVLKYPASFASLKSRNVELTGEAYFEVAKDRLHPFFVKTARQQVEVVGTHFNVSSYRDDEGIKTTLLEGAVRIVAGGKSVLLNPGQESVVKQGVVEIAEVDTDEAIAWKNGYFNFNHEELGSIMNKISRWYDVEIQYDDPELKAQVFSGTVSRFKSVSLVLDKLELTNAVIFKISGKKIIVKKKMAKRP